MSEETQEGAPTPTPAPAPTPTPAPAPTPTPTPAPTPTPTASLPEWMTALPEDLRGNETLARYGSLEDLAKGHVETVTMARQRVQLPKEGDDKSWNEFIGKLRPEKADAYNIPLPEGQEDTSMQDAFRSRAFDLGLHPRQAEGVATWWNAQIADQQSRIEQGARDELKAIELDLGPAGYARREEAARNLLGKMEGVDTDKALVALEKAIGAGDAMKFLFSIAERTGELEKVDPGAVSLRLGTMSPEGAQQEIDKLKGNSEFMDKAMKSDSPEAKRWKDLNAIASGQKPG